MRRLRKALYERRSSGLPEQGEGRIPVSYTHLDVYKRQGEGVWTNLDAIRSFCQRHPELSSYLLLVPDAAGVNPEGLPDFAPVESQADQLQQISGYLGDAVLNIPVYDTLREHRQEYIYYRTDHHWTTLGAWYAYEKMCIRDRSCTGCRKANISGCSSAALRRRSS